MAQQTAKIELENGWTAEADSNCWTLRNPEGKIEGSYPHFGWLLQAAFDKGIRGEGNTLDTIQRSIASLYKYIDEKFPDGQPGIRAFLVSAEEKVEEEDDLLI